METTSDKELFECIRDDNKKAFEMLFHRYYRNLCVYASKIILDEIAAEEIVQDMFVKIWEKRIQLVIETSVKNYLVRSVKNQCLNFIKHKKIKDAHARQMLAEEKNNPSFNDNYIEFGLMKKIEDSINSLPEKRREVFRLSREEGLKYREIAEKLNISIKTVETQMSLAIKALHEKLKDFNTFFILFSTILKK